jgi:four helix bundle protein
MFAHKRLSVFRETMAMTLELYRITAGFPKSKSFLMTNQIRKCASSIPANISEGAARGSVNENVRFLRIALGSLSELDTHLELATGLGYLDQDKYQELQQKLTIIADGLSGLIKYFEKRLKG